MSWSIEERIGECRPFPAQVIVYKGETDECLAYVSGEVADRLKAENAKLREELARARDPQRIGGQADPSSFVYAIEQLREFRWQHATNDEDAVPYINNVAAAHERENAKLRQLVRDYERCSVHADCAKCEYDGKLSEHCPYSPCFPDADELSELGVEVDE